MKPRRPYRPSPWEYREWYPREAKKPPPEHGIKMKKAGATWWGQRWIESLEKVLAGDSGRLSRGRTYARAGRVHDLVIKDGKVTAKVTGSRDTPYSISIELSQLSAPAWDEAVAAMASKAHFAAALLASEMPREIDEAFQSGKSSLFPVKRTELKTDCSCPDWGDPCKHVAAAHYILGEELDRDPFLLFELRGRRKTQVLDALRAARGSGESTEAISSREEEARVPSVALGDIAPADYDRRREPLPALAFSFDAPPVHGAVLKQLGAPAVWRGVGSPADTLSPIIRTAAEAARRIAMAQADEPAEAVVAPATTKRTKPASGRKRRR